MKKFLPAFLPAFLIIFAINMAVFSTYYSIIDRNDVIEETTTIENFAASCVGVAAVTMYTNSFGFKSVEVTCQED